MLTTDGGVTVLGSSKSLVGGPRSPELQARASKRVVLREPAARDSLRESAQARRPFRVQAGAVGALVATLVADLRVRAVTNGRRSVCAVRGSLVAASLLLHSALALAHEPSPEERTTARELALEGHNALQAGDYAQAVDRFSRADNLVHAPTILVDLGRSYIGLGKLVQAHEAFQRVLREGVQADAPAPWHRALAAAQEEDTALKPRLAWVTIHVQGAPAPRLKLDGGELAPASIGVRRAIDPGHRVVVAQAEGFLPALSNIDLSEGETLEIQLELKRDPNYKPPPAPKPQVKRVIVIEKSPTRQRTPAYVAYGVSGAGFLLGGVTAGFMLRARADLNSKCPARHCPLDAASDLSRYHTYGTLSAIGLGVGLVGAGVGTYLLFLPKPKETTDPRYGLTAQISPGYVGVGGSF